MELQVNLNGKLIKEASAHLSCNNRSFRYGDGFFETIKLLNGRILLKDYHFDRLFSSLTRLYFKAPVHFTREFLESSILQVIARNAHQKCARIRLTIFRGDGGLYDPTSNHPCYLIQTWALSETTNQLNTNGLDIDIYHDAIKVADQFSAVKSNSFLCYALGAQWAKQNKLNDCIILNPFGKIADCTIANLFAVKDGVVLTPSLSDGAINGVMRRYLLESLNQSRFPVMEKSIEPFELQECTEVFLTNAISGIKWVKQLGEQSFSNEVAVALHREFIAPLYAG